MRYKIKDLDGFGNSVFGADCFLANFPEIKTTGVELKQMGEFYYIIDNGRMVNDSAFFTPEEMIFLELVF